jgi:hypothetical protein
MGRGDVMTKNRFVVVEGLSSVEKDQFCQRLATRLGWKVDTGQPNEDSYAFFIKKYAGEGMVLSQSHIALDSESQYWGGQNVFSPIQKKELDAEVWSAGILVFYRKPTARLAEDDEGTSKHQMMESRRELIYWLNAQDVNRMTIHHEIDSESEIIERVVKMLESPPHDSTPHPMEKEIIIISTTA